MNAATDPLAWAALADEDLALTRSALRRKRVLSSGACFHAQQCAEKYLKAVLVANQQPFPKTHDLSVLNDLCEKAGVSLALDIDQLDILSSYAVRVRYPGEEPSAAEAQEAFTIARAVRRRGRAALGLR